MGTLVRFEIDGRMQDFEVSYSDQHFTITLLSHSHVVRMPINVIEEITTQGPVATALTGRGEAGHTASLPATEPVVTSSAPSGVTQLEHVCVLAGFNRMLGDICPACEAKR